MEFATDLFDRETAVTLGERLERLLRSVVAAPVPAAEHAGSALRGQRRLLREWNDTARPVSGATLPELFEAQVVRTPQAVAVEHGTDTLTYEQLNARANALAHHLTDQGIGPEQYVALALPRSTDLVVAIPRRPSRPAPPTSPSTPTTPPTASPTCSRTPTPHS
ncbi:AMP-binding protein [Streptomyces tricolor]|nr:AMP-binding protein [Streptomyces tricolor]